MQNLLDLYIPQLEMAYDIETKLIVTLDELSLLANDNKLKEALVSHLRETEDHQQKVLGMLSNHHITPMENTVFFSTMIGHFEDMLENISDPAVLDAGIIASAQAFEHLEIATYGTLAAWAGELELENEQEVLGEILEEEKSADEQLNGLAKGGFLKKSINQAAS